MKQTHAGGGAYIKLNFSNICKMLMKITITVGTEPKKRC